MSRRWIAALIILAIAAALAFAFRGPLSDLTRDQLTRVIYLVLLLVLVSGGALATRSRFGPHWLRDALIWVAILFVAMGLYSVRRDIGALLDPSAPRVSGAAIEIRRSDDGHFWADVALNGVKVRMMVDTGASEIALTPRDARKIGLDPATLNYALRVNTASGVATAAPVTLDEVSIGSITIDNVTAGVMHDESQISLLGMSFLDRLDGYEVKRDALLLHGPRTP